MFVPGSRRYSDPAAYLLTPDKWGLWRAEFCQLVGKAADPARALPAAEDELGEALGELEVVLSSVGGPVRLDKDGDLVISPLSGEDVPAGHRVPNCPRPSEEGAAVAPASFARP
ncbi:hypothetical protein [Arthrobacter sp. NPDC058127]|uniref:hypothetical protein n=1 Tax=Arthrobacter sp. NPDC058127 TaxID=3346351 RepID=UPI0036E0B3C1